MEYPPVRHRNLRALCTRLEHSLLALVDQRDEDGKLLRHDIRGVMNTIGFMVDHDRVDPEHVREMLSRGHALMARVRDYAERECLYLGPGTVSETEAISRDDVRRMLSESPGELQDVIEEAQLVPPTVSDTLPGPRETNPDIGEVEE